MTVANPIRLSRFWGDRNGILVILAILVFASLSVGWSSRGSGGKSDEISCRKLTLKDAKGRDRIVLSVKKKGPVLSMVDAGGKTRIEIMLDDRMGLKQEPEGDGSISSIRFFDRSGNPNIWLRSVDFGEAASSGAALGMSNGSESGHAGVGIDKNGEATLELKGKDSGILARNIRDDASQVTVRDSRGEIRMSLVANSVSDVFRVKINDKDGKEIWRAPQ